MTIFGEISPLWQNPQSFWQFCVGLFTIWQNFDPTLANFVYFVANFHGCHTGHNADALCRDVTNSRIAKTELW